MTFYNGDELRDPSSILIQLFNYLNPSSLTSLIIKAPAVASGDGSPDGNSAVGARSLDFISNFK
jgi:hypothetical protein